LAGQHQDYLERYPEGYTRHFTRPDWKLSRRQEAGQAMAGEARQGTTMADALIFAQSIDYQGCTGGASRRYDPLR
jgi:hypothetical protein